MAKKLQVSDNPTTTWLDIPGGQSNLDSSAGEIDDTILGQSYHSGEVGLITWSLTGDAFYKGFPGYQAKIQKQGTSTVLTAATTTQVGATKTYQIDDTTKRRLDRSVAVVIKDAGATVATADIESIDYLFGRVTFVSGYTPTLPVTFDSGAYFPLATLAKANSYTLTMTADTKEDTDFATVQANGGYQAFSPGLRTVGLSLGGTFAPSVSNFRTELAARNEFLIEIDAAGDGLSIARGFFKLTTGGQSGAVGALEEETLDFTLNVPFLENPALDKPFGWEHDATTTLPSGIQKVLTGWETQTKLTAQYLPSGAAGQSPLDGVRGVVVVTGATLTGDMGSMNTFSVTLQGDGAYTVV